MSGAEVLTDSELWHIGEGDDLVHITCCIDPRFPLCVVGDTSGGMAAEDELANCRTCLELDAQLPPGCPAGYTCPQLEGL